MYTIEIDGKKYSYENNMTLEEIAKIFNKKAYVAKVNNRMRELGYYINYDCKIEFLDLTSQEAIRVYETSLRYIIIMAIEELYPNVTIKFNQSVSRTLICDIKGLPCKIDNVFLKRLEDKMRDIINHNYPILRKKMTKSEAYEYYKAHNYFDKIDVLNYREEDHVNTNICQNYINYMFGYMVPSTGYITEFKLRNYNPGFLISYPRAEEGGKIPEFENSVAFGKMVTEAQAWSKLCDGDTIPKMNKHSESDKVYEFVQMCETKHNDMLAELGLKIKNDIDNIRLIAIAGPSSSGKTTFSNRLRIELMARGIKTLKISIDDYYRDKKDTPLDEDGKPDFEHIEALDIALFNQNLLDLIQGEEVCLPVFDFKLGRRVAGPAVKVGPNEPIIIEGIHALNEILTSSIPKHQKFKIYISPLTQINIDNHNPINATDVRLLRRIVRDSRYRKTTPDKTFSMWSSVRRGEFRWIYPFQEEADYVYNSELTYELGIMKKYALPALQTIDKNSEYFIPANRLIKFLKYFVDIDDKYVPCNSILREFIGGSCFYE